jgi:hypothetical protein
LCSSAENAGADTAANAATIAVYRAIFLKMFILSLKGL